MAECGSTLHAVRGTSQPAIGSRWSTEQLPRILCTCFHGLSTSMAHSLAQLNPCGTASLPAFLHADDGPSSLCSAPYQPGRVTYAAYSPALMAPLCSAPTPICDSGALLHSRGSATSDPPTTMSPAEPHNASNTLFNSCSDGGSGAYHADESLDRIVVVSAGSGTDADGAKPLTAGGSALVYVTVYCYSPTTDSLDLYVTSAPLPAPEDPTSLISGPGSGGGSQLGAGDVSWELVEGSVACGASSDSYTYELGPAALPAASEPYLLAVRGVFRCGPFHHLYIAGHHLQTAVTSSKLLSLPTSLARQAHDTLAPAPAPAPCNGMPFLPLKLPTQPRRTTHVHHPKPNRRAWYRPAGTTAPRGPAPLTAAAPSQSTPMWTTSCCWWCRTRVRGAGRRGVNWGRSG